MEVKEGLNEANKSINAELIARCRELNVGAPWYGRNLKSLLKDTNSDKEVLSILHHMIAWRKYVIQVLQGGQPNIVIDSTDDWPIPTEESRKEDIVSQFIATYRTLLKSIEDFPENRWFENLWHGEYHFHKLVSGLMDHDLYHMGQAVILSKKNKS